MEKVEKLAKTIQQNSRAREVQEKRKKILTKQIRQRHIEEQREKNNGVGCGVTLVRRDR